MKQDRADLLRKVIFDCNFPDSDIRLYCSFLPLGKPISAADTIQGIGRVLLGSFPLMQNRDLKRMVAATLATFSESELNKPPLESSSPLGFIIALNPVRYSKNLIADLVGAKAPCAILDNAEWNPVHVRTIRETLQLVNATCTWNRITGENKNTRSAVLSRIRAQFRHLYSDCFDQSEPIFQNDGERMACTASVCSQTFLQDRLLALRATENSNSFYSNPTGNIMKEGRPVWERIPGNWYLNSVSRRESPDQSLLRDIVNLNDSPPKQRKFLYASVIAAMASDETTEPFVDARRYRAIIQKAQRIPTLSRTRMPGQGATLCPSIEIAMELVEACQNHMSEPGPAGILCTITGAVPPDKLHSKSFEVLDNSTIIRTITKPVNIPVPTDADLHRPTSHIFASITTHKIGKTVKELLSTMSAEQLQQEADNWLKRNSQFKFTFKGFCKTLRYNFPLWMDLPAVYYDIGLAEASNSTPAWRHYINYRLEDFGPPVARFLRSYFDSSFILPNQACKESCGSAFCPEPDKIRTFFSLLGSWLTEPLPSDRDSQIATSNAIAAGCRLAETLLTFTRGRDEFRPLPQNALQNQTACRHKTDIQHEKQYPRVIYYPRALIAFLRTSNQCLQRIAESTASKPSSNQIGFAYWFLPTDNQLFNIDWESKTPPYRLLVSSALNQHTQTRNLTFLHPNGMRNLSNLILRRDSVFAEDAVLAIHDHYPNRAHSPLEFDCLQHPVMEAEREKASEHLCQCLGLGRFCEK